MKVKAVSWKQLLCGQGGRGLKLKNRILPQVPAQLHEAGQKKPDLASVDKSWGCCQRENDKQPSSHKRQIPD